MSNRRWTKEEIEWLKDNYGMQSWEVLTNTLSRKKDDIIHKAYKLGVKRNNVKNSAYADEEDDILKKYYKEMSLNDIRNKYLPYRTEGSLRCRVIRLGLIKRHSWSDEELEILMNNYKTHTIAELVLLLPNHSRISIYNKIVDLELFDAPMYRYTDEQKDFIKDNFMTMTDAEIGRVLNRSAGSIKEYRRKLGCLRVNKHESNYKDITRFIQRRNIDWKKASMEACGYKCVVTGGEFDDIHHLYSKNMIIQETLDYYNLDDSFDINEVSEDFRNEFLKTFEMLQSKYPLGVCLTRDLHKQFHIRYGFGDNTPEQFEEFLNWISQNQIEKITA